MCGTTGDWTEELVPIACVYLIWAADGWAQSVNCHLIHSGQPQAHSLAPPVASTDPLLVWYTSAHPAVCNRA